VAVLWVNSDSECGAGATDASKNGELGSKHHMFTRKTSSLCPHQPFQLKQGLSLASLTPKWLKICFFSSYQPLSPTLSLITIQKGASFVLLIPVCIIDPFPYFLI
jgi:hypothetical protein